MESTAKGKVGKTHNPLSKCLYSSCDNPCIYGNSKCPVSAWMPQRALGEWQASFPSKTMGRWTSSLLQQNIYMYTSASFEKHLPFFSRATPRKNKKLFLEIADPHLSAKEPGSFECTSLLAFSPGLSCRCTFQEGRRQSRWMVCWQAQNTSRSTESRVIAVHAAAVCHPLPRSAALN